MMKNFHLPATLLLVFALTFLTIAPLSSAKVKDFSVRGYITQVLSPASFEMDDYSMYVDPKVEVDLENIDDKSIKFDPQKHLRVGTLVKIKGKIDTDTQKVTVKELKIDFKQFRTFSKTVVLDAAPTQLTKSEAGVWTGKIVADARRILINEKTVVRFKLNKSEEREAKEAKRQKEAEEEAKSEAAKKAAEAEKEQIEVLKKEKKEAEGDLANKSDDDEPGFEEENDINELLIGAQPLNSLDQVGPGVYMTYKGRENEDGSVIAESVVFVKNEKTKQEKNLWKELRLKAKEAKTSNAFSTIKIGEKKYKVLPEKEIQEYVQRLGESLIPEYQQKLPDDDENKIPFNFNVVFEKGINAAAYATGTVVIHHDVFNSLENEAQLAFLLSHEIVHATQEHTIRAMNKDKGKRTGLFIGRVFAIAMGYGLLARSLELTEAAMVNGYARNQENQADRIALSYMLAAGYDLREAPRTWKVFSQHEGDRPTNFFWSDHASHAERRSFLNLTIRNTFFQTDFNLLKKDSDEFHKIADIIQQKYPGKKKKGAKL